jgi:hypothetical protein
VEKFSKLARSNFGRDAGLASAQQETIMTDQERLNHIMSSTNEEYLGDGLYVSFDGFMITFRTPRQHGDHLVMLEPEMFAALVEYQKRVTTPTPEDNTS